MAPTIIEPSASYNWNYTRRLDEWIPFKSLGKGAQGEVALCKNRSSGRIRAIKTRMTRKERIKKYLPCEISIQWDYWQHNMYTDRGANLVKVDDFWFDKEHQSVIVMEYCDEGDLKNWIMNQVNITGEQYRVPNYLVAHVAAHLFNGAVYMHSGQEFDFEHGKWRTHSPWPGAVVHRDIKPDNVMIRTKKRTNDRFDLPEFAIGDLGLATLISEEHRIHLEFRQDVPNDVRAEVFHANSAGTPDYMAPEYKTEENLRATPQMDVYGLGATLVVLMAGVIPKKAEDYENLLKSVSYDYDGELVDVVRRLVDPNPNSRLRSGELRNLMPRLLSIRDYHAIGEDSLPKKSWIKWSQGYKGHASAALKGLRMSGSTRKPKKPAKEDRSKVGIGLGAAIMGIGGSRERFRRNSNETKRQPTTMDALRMSVPPRSVFRANLLQMFGGQPSPNQPEVSIRDALDSDVRQVHRRVRSLPQQVNLVRRGAVRKHRDVDYDYKGRPIRPGKPRRDSMDFECQGLDEGASTAQPGPSVQRPRTADAAPPRYPVLPVFAAPQFPTSPRYGAFPQLPGFRFPGP